VLDELLAAERPTIHSGRSELPLDDVLRGDPAWSVPGTQHVISPSMRW
jgi:hypothetical protein